MSVEVVKAQSPNEGAGVRYRELLADGLSKEEAARQALAEVKAKKRATS